MSELSDLSVLCCVGFCWMRCCVVVSSVYPYSLLRCFVLLGCCIILEYSTCRALCLVVCLDLLCWVVVGGLSRLVALRCVAVCWGVLPSVWFVCPFCVDDARG